MRTKFIEGTNKQYSIREDGVVISHWRKLYNVISYQDKVLKPGLHKSTGRVTVSINRKRTSLKSLVMSHFGEHRNCKKWIIEHIDGDLFNCAYSNLKYKPKKITTKEKRRKQQRIVANSRTKKITKSYIAQVLNLPVSQLPEELYQHHKDLILFKRKISKQFGVSMIHLNKL